MTSNNSSVMGFLTTSLHKNCQNDVKLLETWWFWPILGKVERAELTCDVIKKSCSTFLIKFWLYASLQQIFNFQKKINLKESWFRDRCTKSILIFTSIYKINIWNEEQIFVFRDNSISTRVEFEIDDKIDIEFHIDLQNRIWNKTHDKANQ